MNNLLDFRKNARTSPLHYLILAMGLIFVFGAFSIDPAKHCVEYSCPIWLRGLGGGIGGLFALGSFNALWRGFEWGSRVDISRRALIWWEGVPPVEERVIPADEISVIQIDSSSDNTKIMLLDPHGNRVHLPEQCIPFRYNEWARQVSQTFPHITVKEIEG
jgi:hypothetical protein